MNVIGDGKITLGKKVNEGENVTVIFKKNCELVLGDYVTLGENVKIVIDDGDVKIGDWSTIHANGLILSKKGVSIGQHCWFGQNCVIDGTGGLTVEDGVRVGMYSQIWTHVAAGEQIEGCKLFSSKPTTIKKDAWLVGSCVVGSGVSIGRKTICLGGSNVTRSLPDECVATGSPAQVRERLSFYKPISMEEKFRLMCLWVKEFCEEFDHPYSVMDLFRIEVGSDKRLLIYLKKDDFSAELVVNNQDVLFCIEDKVYIKSYTELEAQLIRFLSGNKARFYPLQTALS